MMHLQFFVDTEDMRATKVVFIYLCISQAVDSVSTEMFNNINTFNL